MRLCLDFSVRIDVRIAWVVKGVELFFKVLIHFEAVTRPEAPVYNISFCLPTKGCLTPSQSKKVLSLDRVNWYEDVFIRVFERHNWRHFI